MSGFYGITGTPGTGKKTITPIVAQHLRLPSYSLNDFLSPKETRSGVDPRKLGRRVKESVSGPAVLFGHLLPYALPPSSMESVVVLRCGPAELKKRLTHRRYGKSKVRENVEAELIGLISAEAFRRYGADAVRELDTTSTPPQIAARSVLSLLIGKTRGRRYDWTVSYDSPLKLNSLLSTREG